MNNSSVSKIFTGKLYFLVELLLAASAYCMITMIFYHYTEDESFFNAFYYGGIFIVIQMIWQLFQERQDSANEEADHYPLKLSFFFFLTIFFGAIFLGLYFLFFHDVLSLHFKPIGPLDLLEVKEVDSKPDDYIRVQAFYDKYWSLAFSMNAFDQPDLPSNAVGCGCGVVFGPLLGTIASPVSATDFSVLKFQEIVLMPTMTCFCNDADNCHQLFDTKQVSLYYRINGNYENAIQNTQCPPETMDFIQIYIDSNVNIFNAQVIILFTLAYIPLMFMFINFMLNYSKFGVITFIKNHPNVRPKGLTYLLAYMLLKWVVIALYCFFIAERLVLERHYMLAMMTVFSAVPGIIFGLFFFYFNPNFKFMQEFKAGVTELKDYAESTHESVENFVDLCVVGLQLLFKYLNRALRELVISLGFKGIAQSTSLFVLIAPEFITEFINHEPVFQQYPTNIRDNLIINSMILMTGLFHGLLMGAALIVYQAVFAKFTVLGIIAAATAFLFFIASTEWFVRQLIYFKSPRKALASHLIWLYPAFEIILNRSLVNMYYNRTESRSEIPEQ